MTEVTMTPLGIDPPSCPTCGEWKGASDGLSDSVHRHSKCVSALREIQWAAYTSSEASAFKDRVVGIADAIIGPLDQDDYKEQKS